MLRHAFPSLSRYVNYGHSSIFGQCFHTSAFLKIAGIPIKMPSLSPTMSEGTIVKWLKKEGDELQPGDIICEIQTDKAVVSLETEDEGILAKIIIEENSKDIKVGDLIALSVDAGEDWQSVDMPKMDDASSPSDVILESSSDIQKVNKSIVIGPSVRKLCEQYGINLESVNPSGPHNNVLKGDILEYIRINQFKPKVSLAALPKSSNVYQDDGVSKASTLKVPRGPPKSSVNDFIDFPLSSIRRTAGMCLTESKTNIPHAYCQVDSNIDELLSLHQRLKSEGVLISLNDLLLKCVGICLKLHSVINSTWRNGEIVQHPTTDISVAIPTDGGILTPIITDVSSKTVIVIGSIMKDLISRAKEGRLQPEEFQGGSFTISNLGMFGVKTFKEIINPPQCGILAIGEGRTEVGLDGQVETIMSSTFSYDSRVISASEAAAFMESVTTVLSSPTFLEADARHSAWLTSEYQC